MGVYDRDYYRDERPHGLWWDGHLVTPWLVLIHAGVFVLQLVTAGRAWHGKFTDMFMLDPHRVATGEVWRIFTGLFIHDIHNWLNLVWNALILWFFGRQLEIIYGPRRFVLLYLLAGVAGNLTWLMADWLWNVGARPIAFGAAPALTFVLILCALHYPRQTVLLFFVLPVPFWLIAVLYVAKDLVAFLQQLGGLGHPTLACVHLAGAGFAVAYYYAPIGRDTLADWRTRWSMTRSSSSRRAAAPCVDEHLEAQADAILDKLARHGRDALTPQEWEILHRASEAYRRRR
ncbi:MAG: rhomboid family intramembrane serine protease [Gemmatales bacterium]|nr:rhomboid family intramembrane serine protease [Gemmatales bacterium]MDW7995928.1 rhomboid family intramembrane serine protease [Gemmatales bacterium]